MINRRIVCNICLTLITVVLVFNPVIQGKEIRISVPEILEISTPWIRLGDIARIEGLSGNKLKNVKDIILGKAMLPGYTRQVSRDHIKLLLQKAGLSLNNTQLDIPVYVKIKTASKILKKEELIDFAKSYLRHMIDYPPQMINIRARYMPPDITLPDRIYILKAKIPDKKDFTGNVPVQVLIVIDENIYKKVYMSFEITREYRVYAAKRTINTGEKIKREDFYQTSKHLTGISGDLITDWDNSLIRDGVVRIQIPKEGVLTDYYLTLPDVIENGDIVQVEIITGNIKVSTTVKARQSGKKGEYIIVENIKTGYKFKARVINSHLVRMIRN